MGVREGLLVLLDRGTRHGYGLKSDFENATGGVWPLNVGQVYTTLERLERDGLVASESMSDGQRGWRLTDEGRGELGSWWWATAGREPPPRDELVLKVMLAVAGDPTHALDVIAHQRDALLTLLATRRREAKARTGREDLAADLVVDVLVLRAEADVRWLDLCEQRLVDRAQATTEKRPRSHRKGADR